MWPVWTNARLWPIVIPARLTWLLQALDTHAFAAFKVRIQRLFQDARLGALDGTDILKTLLTVVVRAIHEVFDYNDWSKPFASNGMSHQQRRVSARVKTHLGLAGHAIIIPKTRPSVEQLKKCFPRRAHVPVGALFRPLVASSRPGAVAAVDPSGHHSSAPSHSVWPIAFRTRSRLTALRARVATDVDATVAAPMEPSSSSGAAFPIALRTRSRTAPARYSL